MTYDLHPFLTLVKEGDLRKSEKGNLILFGYTDQCTFKKNWNAHTRIARGLILDKVTGKLVAKPFPKFFNLNEMEETQLSNLPKLPYKVFEKVDGSLGIVFHHDGAWHIATRGSFFSEQAVKAAQILEKYRIHGMPTNVTLLVEIIYPENRIIVDYGKEEKLVALGAFDVNSGQEYDPLVAKLMVESIGMSFAKIYEYTIEEMIALQKRLPKDQEGFVVRFEDGFRVKIKGEEYMRIARILSHMTPLTFWEAMRQGKVPVEYLAQIPEEFKQDFEPIVESLEAEYEKVLSEINQDITYLPTVSASPEGRKQIGLFLKETDEVKHKNAIFPFITQNHVAVEGYIMKQIRPKGNVLTVDR